MLLKCPECFAFVSDAANACPHCGNPIQTILHETKKELANVPETIRGKPCEMCNERYAKSQYFARLNKRKLTLMDLLGIRKYQYITIAIPLCEGCYEKIQKKEHSMLGWFLSSIEASPGTIALRNHPVIKKLRKEGWSLQPPLGKKI